MAKEGGPQGAPEEYRPTSGRTSGALVYHQRIGPESGADSDEGAEAPKTKAKGRRLQRYHYGPVARAGFKAETARKVASFHAEAPHHESGRLNHAFSGDHTVRPFDGGKASG